MYTDPSYHKTTDTDMALGSSLGLDVPLALSGNTGHLDQHGPWGQHSPLISTWSPAYTQIMESSWLLVETWATDFGTVHS